MSNASNAIFNKLNTNETLIYDLKVKNISLTQDTHPHIITDSPFKVGDQIVNNITDINYITNASSPLGYVISETSEDKNPSTTITFNNIVDDDNNYTLYNCSVQTSKKGILLPNIFFIYNKRDKLLINERVEVNKEKKIYSILWDQENDDGSMYNLKHQTCFRKFYWKKSLLESKK